MHTLSNHSLKEDIRAYWSKRAESFDQSTGHKIEDSAEAPEWQRLFSAAFGDLEGKAVLDLACGTGEISRMMLSLGASVTGVDFSEAMLSRAKAKNSSGRYRTYLGDAESLTTEEDGRFDCVVTRHLVWTLTNPHQAFAEWRRVLKPGGRLLVVDGDWVSSPLRARLVRALAARLSPPTLTSHEGIDRNEHNRILSQVHYAEGLTASQLRTDLAAAGFNVEQQFGMNRIYLWGMRKAPLADRLRLLASQRFAVLAVKPA